MNVPARIILSRPDAIGDAMVTMPMAGWIKHHAPGTHITVIARRYALPVWAHCTQVDAIVALEDLQAAKGSDAGAIVHVFPHREVARWAKQAATPRRIGTSHRWWHWLTCNERVNFSRKHSDLHEAQLNMKLLEPFGIPVPENVNELVAHQGFQPPPPSPAVAAHLQAGKRHVILHPHSRGSAVEWGLDNFSSLIRSLDPSRWQVIITGTEEEASRYRTGLPLDLPHVTDVGGRLSLEELIQLIGASDALVAASTGPLHIAAACGIRAIGLFSMRRPIFPARWAPIGRDAHALVFDPACPNCAAGKACDCITRIEPRRVLDLLEKA